MIGDLDVSDVIACWEQPYTIQSLSEDRVNYSREKVLDPSTARSQLCFVQPTDLEKINVDTFDYRLRHIDVHSRSPLPLNDVITYNGVNYIFKQEMNAGDFGFYEVIAEEFKSGG